MSDFTLTRTRIRAGCWEGILKAEEDAGEPEITAVHLGQPVDGLSVTEDATLDRTWIVRLNIPAELLSDGVQSFLFQDKNSGETLDSFSIVTGEAVSDDLAAEIDLLRAELDMLKRAFRRHCLETG